MTTAPTRRSQPEYALPTLSPRPRGSKYNVAPKADRTLEGILFASQGEMNRWAELKLLERAGEIRGLLRQPVIPIIINDIEVCRWIGDFFYVEGGEQIFEDFKGMDNALSKLKRKLVEAHAGIKVRITGRPKR